MLDNYNFRMFVKEQVAKVYDTYLYAHFHPLSALKRQAHESTMRFINENCIGAIGCRTAKKVLNIALNEVKVEGEYFEFGVYKGGSIKHIANSKKDKTIHGFDSFTGLPEKWGHYNKNDFSLDGQFPKAPKNVKFHKGYFKDVLPSWSKENPGKVAFMHIDCDLYKSTITVFKNFWDKLQAGTVMVFDDYFNFPGWENDGHRAFNEFIELKPIEYQYLAYGYKELAVLITSIK